MKYKKYRIIYSFNDRKLGFNNSITVTALNVDDAIKDAQKQVQEVYGIGMMSKFRFKPDPLFNGVVA